MIFVGTARTGGLLMLGLLAGGGAMLGAYFSDEKFKGAKPFLQCQQATQKDCQKMTEAAIEVAAETGVQMTWSSVMAPAVTVRVSQLLKNVLRLLYIARCA